MGRVFKVLMVCGRKLLLSAIADASEPFTWWKKFPKMLEAFLVHLDRRSPEVVVEMHTILLALCTALCSVFHSETVQFPNQTVRFELLVLYHLSRRCTSSLYGVSLLQTRPTTVVSPENFVLLLELDLSTQSWFSRVNNSGLRMQPLRGSSAQGGG